MLMCGGFLLSVSDSGETFIRKDAGFENRASTARSGLGRLGYVPAGRRRGVAHAWKTRLPLNFLPKPLAKSFTPNMNSPYNAAYAGCMGCSCSLRATYLRSLHQAAPVPKCYNSILVGKISDYAGGNTKRRGRHDSEILAQLTISQSSA
jgi:hypothetical protein